MSFLWYLMHGADCAEHPVLYTNLYTKLYATTYTIVGIYMNITLYHT
jgi:hypothetical protein